MLLVVRGVKVFVGEVIVLLRRLVFVGEIVVGVVEFLVVLAVVVVVVFVIVVVEVLSSICGSSKCCSIGRRNISMSCSCNFCSITVSISSIFFPFICTYLSLFISGSLSSICCLSSLTFDL